MSKKQQKQKTKPTTDTLIVEDNDVLLGVENEIKNQNQQTFNSNVLSLKKVETLNRLTKYEKARIIGTRAAQIQNGMSAVFLKDGIQVTLPDEFKDVVKDSVGLAKLELKLKSSPLIIRRVYPSGKIIEKTIQELD
jgi:DNA-directed RNA polymerase I, II, and III subunit RPABC2